MLPALLVRPLVLVGGSTPFVFTHLFVKGMLGSSGAWKEMVVRNVVGRVMEDDRFENRVWNSKFKEV